jgi:NADPH-dependent glutamate synthase beta subunit-like oxidoreductase
MRFAFAVIAPSAINPKRGTVMTITSGTPWESKRLPRYPRLKKSGHFDVAVIGGGITGLSAAYFLK